MTNKQEWHRERRAKLATMANELSDAIHAYNMAFSGDHKDDTFGLSPYVNMAHSIADHFAEEPEEDENPFHPESPEGRAWEISNG